MNDWTPPIPFSPCPGFYLVPGNDRVVVSISGECRSRLFNKSLIQQLGNHGYPMVRVAKNHSRKAYLVHRLLCLTFLPIPEELKRYPRKKLHVNHIDANKLNYSLSNLEWCVAKHNVRHTHKLNLFSSSRRVLARNVLTEEVLCFNSIQSAAQAFELPTPKFYCHLNSDLAGMITSDWCVFKFDDGQPWPELKKVDEVESKWWYNRVVVGRQCESGKQFLFNSIREATEILGLNYDALVSARLINGHHKPYNGWVFEKRPNAVGLDTSTIPGKSRRKGRPATPVEVVEKDGKVLRFDSAVLGAKHVDLSIAAFVNHLKSGEPLFDGQVVRRV